VDAWGGLGKLACENGGGWCWICALIQFDVAGLDGWVDGALWPCAGCKAGMLGWGFEYLF
jgi:hypothetical protein